MKKKTSYLFLVIMAVFLLTSIPAYAEDPVLVTGTKKLFADGFLWITVLIGVTAVFKVGWHAWMRSMAENEGDKSDQGKKIKNTLIFSVFGLSASGITTLVLSYYGL